MRIAMLRALPSDDEVLDAGFADGGDYMIALKLRPSEYTTWLNTWYDEHAEPIDERMPLAKATQPPERALDHLLLLMVRSIESVTTAEEKRDLAVSAGEMRSFNKASSGAK